MAPERNTAFGDSAYGDGGRRHVCPICSQGFGRTEHLDRHLAAHRGSRPWVCEYCRSRFSRKYGPNWVVDADGEGCDVSPS